MANCVEKESANWVQHRLRYTSGFDVCSFCAAWSRKRNACCVYSLACTEIKLALRCVVLCCFVLCCRCFDERAEMRSATAEGSFYIFIIFGKICWLVALRLLPALHSLFLALSAFHPLSFRSLSLSSSHMFVRSLPCPACLHAFAWV